MTKELLIVFVKNIKLGKVKTRLAKTIGDQAAFEVYKELVGITEKASQEVNKETWIYFSDVVIETKWQGCNKYIQEGEDLGIKMKNAFQHAFEKGYEKVVLIGSDLPTINSAIISQAFDRLENKKVVFGPAVDGGYYLVGLTKPKESIFKNKPWSQSNLLEVTTLQLEEEKQEYSLLETLNDIDTYQDMVASGMFKKYEKVEIEEI